MSSKSFVKVESSQEQQDNLRNSRKTLKVLQRASTDKENLAGRPVIGAQKAFVKSKSENDFNDTGDIKRKKLASQSERSASAACTVAGSASAPSVVATAKGRRSSELLNITEEDLQTDAAAELSEGYWRELAEKRRLALDATLIENQELHEMNTSLKEQLDVSNQMLDESRNLVEILTEMLDEIDDAKKPAGDGEFEEGESSKSFLHASLAEEANEEGMAALANNATDKVMVTPVTPATITHSDDADDEDDEDDEENSRASSSSSSNKNDAPKGVKSASE